MVVENYISNHIIPLKIDDNFKLSIKLMEEIKLSYFPVLENGVYCGLISDLKLYELENFGEQIVKRRNLLEDIYIYNTQTIFEATPIILENGIDILPVIDSKRNYLGVLTLQSMLKAYSNYTAADEQGGIIRLSLHYNDLYISEISRIIEEENSRIINLIVTPVKESTELIVTVKINKIDMSRIVKSLERHDYKIEYVTNADEIGENNSKNYDLLMKYLSI